MVAKKNEGDLATQVSLLTQQISTFISAAQEINRDHEKRLRTLEDLVAKIDGKFDKEIGVIKERQTISNILQTAFTSVAAVIATIFGGNK